MKKKMFLAAVLFAVLFAVVLAGCASMILLSVESESVKGPERVRQYGDINPKDIIIYGNYKDGSRKQISVSKGDISFDNSKPGVQTVKVNTGKEPVNFQTEVMALTGLTITSSPKAWKLGVPARVPKSSAGGVSAAPGNDQNNWPGLEIQGVWDKLGSEKISASAIADECQFSGFDPNKAGAQNVTVAWKGKQTTFSVNVVAMDSLKITTLPTKTVFGQGEQLDTRGIKVTGTWPGIGEEAISNPSFSGYDPAKIGKQTVTVTANGKSATFGVEVVLTVNGTWTQTFPETSVSKQTVLELRFNNGNEEYYIDGVIMKKGTYTINGNTITRQTTLLNYSTQGLKTKAEWVKLAGADIAELGFSPAKYKWSISGNTLTLQLEGEEQSSVWTKK